MCHIMAHGPELTPRRPQNSTALSMQDKMQIRTATKADSDDIRRIHLSAFPEEERDIVSELAVKLLCGEDSASTVSLVAESEDGRVVGHVALSPVIIDKNASLQGYVLGPLGVESDYQNRGIGSKLVQEGKRRLQNQGVNILFVYGNPGYYGRFGFGAVAASSYIAPYKLKYPHGWLALALDGIISPPQSPVAVSCVAALCDEAFGNPVEIYRNQSSRANLNKLYIYDCY